MKNDLQGEFGVAYVKAVAHAAGFFIQESSRMLDALGIDLLIFESDPTGPVSNAAIGVQVKTTSASLNGDPFSYDLKVKNYNDLRAEGSQFPIILVLVAVPSDRAAWVTASTTELALRHCGYWHSLRGAPSTENTSTVAVPLSKAKRFHPEQLVEIIGRVREGGLP